MAHQDIRREVARQAAYWLMLLHSGEASSQQLRDCDDWRQADPAHERAWQRGVQIQQQLGLLPPPLAMNTLGRERRDALKTLLVLALATPTGYVAWQQSQRRQWLADQRTGVGERRSLTLEDGSRLSLNSDSAVDVRFSAQERLIVLRRGEILVDSGTDAAHPGTRPLRVQTAQGLLQPIGTRFTVRRLDEQALTRLAVFEGAVRVQPDRGRAVTVAAGQQLSFASTAVGPMSEVPEEQASWVRGQLMVDDQPLGDFLGELARHRNGWLRCSPEVADLRISGTFQLDNTDAILAALPAILPVAVESRTRYWVTVRGR